MAYRHRLSGFTGVMAPYVQWFFIMADGLLYHILLLTYKPKINFQLNQKWCN